MRSGGGGEKSDAAARDKSGGGPKYDHGLPGPQDAGRDRDAVGWWGILFQVRGIQRAHVLGC